MTIRCCLAFILVTTLVEPLSAVDLAQIDRSIAREPTYKTKAPKYCLLVFGPEAKTRVWLVFDGDTLYVDRNGNGDLTEKDEMVALPEFTKADKTSRFFSGTRRIKAGLVTAFPKGWQELTLEQMQIDPMREPANAEEARILNHPGRPCDGLITLIDLPLAAGVDDTGFLQFAPRPGDTPIIHFNGPLQITLQPMQVFKRGRESDLRLGVGTPGLGKGTFTFRPHEDVPKEAHPVVEIEFSHQEAGKPPIKLSVTLNKRCCGNCFHGPVLVPGDAALGPAKVFLSFNDWKSGRVTAGTGQIPVAAPKAAASMESRRT
ncbi:MAG: hypothetical protein U0792_14525 [Gemmataceae bacterium]